MLGMLRYLLKAVPKEKLSLLTAEELVILAKIRWEIYMSRKPGETTYQTMVTIPIWLFSFETGYEIDDIYDIIDKLIDLSFIRMKENAIGITRRPMKR